MYIVGMGTIFKILLFYPKLYEDIKAASKERLSLACLLVVLLGFLLLAFIG